MMRVMTRHRPKRQTMSEEGGATQKTSRRRKRQRRREGTVECALVEAAPNLCAARVPGTPGKMFLFSYFCAQGDWMMMTCACFSLGVKNILTSLQSFLSTARSFCQTEQSDKGMAGPDDVQGCLWPMLIPLLFTVVGQ